MKHPIPSLLALTLWFPLRRRLGRATNTCWLRGGLNVLAPRMCGAIRPDGDHTSHSWWGGPEPTHPIPNIALWVGLDGQMAALARARAMQERDRPTSNVWPNSCGQPQNPDLHALQAFPSSVNRMLVNRGNTYPVQMAPTLQPYLLSIFEALPHIYLQGTWVNLRIPCCERIVSTARGPGIVCFTTNFQRGH